jgi:hypothetical protein
MERLERTAGVLLARPDRSVLEVVLDHGSHLLGSFGAICLQFRAL